ncbi:MAG: hypothetical protein ACI4EH_11295 [Oliverpabstia sp.]
MRNPNYSYGFRIAVGVYLFYLAYQLVGGYIAGKSESMAFLFIGIAFAMVGIVCAVTGIRYFVTGKGDKKDVQSSSFEEPADDTTEE